MVFNKAIVLKNIYTQSITSSPLNNISHITPYHLATLYNRKSIRLKIKPDSHQSLKPLINHDSQVSISFCGE